MKKQLLIVGIILVLLTVGLCGCNEIKTNEEKVLGTWVADMSGMEGAAVFNFFSNGTCSISGVTTSWGTYVITDETLAIEVGGNTNPFEYSFSDKNKKLSLISKEQASQIIVLTKYESQEPIPSIRFTKDNMYNTLTVSDFDPSDLKWKNIEITGTCNTSGLGTYVREGDMITDCLDTINIRDVSTNILLGTWTFTEPTPSIQFFKDNEDRTLTVAQADPADILWSDINIDGTCDASGLGTYVIAGDRITECSGTITISHIPTNALLGVWEFT
jgi:hypothetical protein